MPRLLWLALGQSLLLNLLQKSGIANKNIGKGLSLHPAPFVMDILKKKFMVIVESQCPTHVMNLESQTMLRMADF